MPHPFPSNAQEILNRKVPYDYELYWVRAIVTNVKLQTPGGLYMQGFNPTPFTVIQCFDIDAAAQSGAIKAYDINLRGDWTVNKYEPGDAMSFYGHRRKGETRVRPRFILNHNTRKYKVAYYDMVQEDGHVGSEFTAGRTIDSWLKCTVKRKYNRPKRFLGTLFRYVLTTAIICALLFAIGYFGGSTKDQKEFLSEFKKIPMEYYKITFVIYVFIGSLISFFCSRGYDVYDVDLEPAYNAIQNAIQGEAEQNPAPKLGFVVNSRHRDD